MITQLDSLLQTLSRYYGYKINYIKEFESYHVQIWEHEGLPCEGHSHQLHMAIIEALHKIGYVQE